MTDYLDTHVGVLGRTGTGKTYTARGFVEQLLDARRQVVIVDPTGAWFGLRTVYPIPIFGGEHGDIEISDSSGAAVAETILANRTSAIVDLSLLARQSGAGMRRFMTAFVARMKDRERGAMWLVLDEADEFLPQVLSPDMTHLFGDLKWIVRRGRIAGWRVMMITQRPQDIAKSVLTQIGTLIAHRLTAPQDRKAIEEWVKGHADPGEAKQVLSTLASLDRGEAWVWAPDLGLLERTMMPPIRSFDSGATPDADTGVIEQPALAEIDLSGIRAALAAKSDSQKPTDLATDDNRLSDENARLVAQVSDLIRANADCASVISDQLEQMQRMADHAEHIVAIAKELPASGAGQEAAKASEPLSTFERSGTQTTCIAEAACADGIVIGRPFRLPPRDTKIGAERRPLAALAQVYPSGLTEAQWATSAGMKRSGGTWGTYKSRLRSAGLIEARDGRWFATEAGAGAVGEVELPPPPGPDLARWWAGKLQSVGPMAEVLIAKWPHWISRNDLADALDMAAGGGSFGTYLSRLSGPGLIERGADGVRLSDEVMKR